MQLQILSQIPIVECFFCVKLFFKIIYFLCSIFLGIMKNNEIMKYFARYGKYMRADDGKLLCDFHRPKQKINFWIICLREGSNSCRSDRIWLRAVCSTEWAIPGWTYIEGYAMVNILQLSEIKFNVNKFNVKTCEYSLIDHFTLIFLNGIWTVWYFENGIGVRFVQTLTLKAMSLNKPQLKLHVVELSSTFQKNYNIKHAKIYFFIKVNLLNLSS